MTYPNEGGGGGSVLIVATRSDNSAPAVFADIAARDVYTATSEGTADAARINVASSAQAREVFAVGTLSGNDVTGITSAFIRLNGAWVSVATNLVGTPGQDGMGTIDQSIPVGTLLEAGPDGSGGVIAAAAPITNATGALELNKLPNFMGGEVDFVGFSIQNVGGQLVLLDRNSNQHYDLASRPFDTTNGSGTFSIDNRAAQSTGVFQNRADQDVVIADGDALGVNIIEAETALINTWTTAAHANAAGKFFIRIRRGTDANAPIDYESHSPDQVAAGAVFTLNGGNVTHPLPKPLLMVQGLDYFVEFVAVNGQTTFRGTTSTQADADDPDNILAEPDQEVPYFATDFQVSDQDEIALMADIMRLQGEITALQNSAFNSGRAYDVFQDGFTITDANIAQHEDINNIYAAKNDKLLDVPSRPDIHLPTDAHIAAAGEPYPVTFEFTHLGGSARFEDRNLLRFFLDGTLLETVFRDQVVIVTKPGVGQDYQFQVSNFDPTVVLLPSGAFVLKPETPINNIATISTELASVTIIGGNAFRVEVGGSWSGFQVPNNSVLVALVDSPSLADSAANNDWLLLENGRINTDVAALLANFPRTGIQYDASRNIRVHPDNVTVFNSMATGTPITRQIGGNQVVFGQPIRFDDVPMQFADLVGGRLDIMFSQSLSFQRGGFEPEPLTLDIVYGATTFTFDISGVDFSGSPVRLSIPIAPEDYSAILNTDASFRWNYNFRGAAFLGSYTVSAALNTATGTLHDPIISLIQQADLALKADLENQIRLLQGNVDENANTFEQINPFLSPPITLTQSTPDVEALFLDSTGVDAFPSDLSTMTAVSAVNPRFTGGNTALFVALAPGGNFALENITNGSVVVLDSSELTVDLGESVTFNGMPYFVYRVTGLTSGHVYEVDRQTTSTAAAWAEYIRNLQADVVRINAELSHALLNLSPEVAHVLDALTVTEQSNATIEATDYNNQLSGPASTDQSVFYETSPVAGSGGLKQSKPLSDLTGDQVQRKLLYIPEGVTFNNQASYVTAFDGTTGRDLISYANGVFSANVFVPAIPAGTATSTIYPAPSNRVSGDGIWHTIEALTFVNGVPVPEADELFFTRQVPNSSVTLNIAYRGHANGNIFGASTATLAGVGGSSDVTTSFVLNDGSETATVQVLYRAASRDIRVSVTERVNAGLPTINDVQVILSYDETRTVPATNATTRQVAIENVHNGWQVFAFRPAASGNLAIVGDNLEIDTGYSFATLFGAGLGGHLVVGTETATFLNFEDFDPIHTTVADLENHAGLPQFGLFVTVHTSETDLNIPVTLKPQGFDASELPISEPGQAGIMWNDNGTPRITT